MKQPSLYSKMVNSMAPAVYGHEEVKRGVSHLLITYLRSFFNLKIT